MTNRKKITYFLKPTGQTNWDFKKSDIKLKGHEKFKLLLEVTVQLVCNKLFSSCNFSVILTLTHEYVFTLLCLLHLCQPKSIYLLIFSVFVWSIFRLKTQTLQTFLHTTASFNTLLAAISFNNNAIMLFCVWKLANWWFLAELCNALRPFFASLLPRW